MTMATRIPGHEEAQLKRWFRRTSASSSTYGVKSPAGALETVVAPIKAAISDAKRDLARRKLEMLNELRRQGIKRKASDPWDLIPITAQPGTPKPGTHDGYMPNEDAMLEAGGVRKRLARMEHDAESVWALFFYYGDVGDRYELGNQPVEDKAPSLVMPQPGAGISSLRLASGEYGQLPRVYCLVQLTHEGLELMAEAERLFGKTYHGTTSDRIQVILQCRDRENYQPLAYTIERATLAADARYARAVAAWNATSRA